jgi:hypothetical protein
MTRHSNFRIPAALLAALLVVGCSSPQTVTESTGEGDQVTESSAPSDKATKAPAKEPAAKLVKTGIGGNKEYAWVAAIVTNASADNVGMFVTVNFNLLDKDGELVATQDQVEQFTSAEQTLAIGTQVEMEGKAKIAKVEATLGLDNKTPMDDVPNLPVGKVKVKDTEYEGQQAVFEVKNPGDAAQKDARVGVVCLNKAGKIIGGGSAYPELIPAKGRVLVEAGVLTTGKPATCEAHATPSTF